jgi:hypothetical protein
MVSVVTGAVVVVTGTTIAGVLLIRIVTDGVAVVVGTCTSLGGLSGGAVVVGSGTPDPGLIVSFGWRAPYCAQAVPSEKAVAILQSSGANESVASTAGKPVPAASSRTEQIRITRRRKGGNCTRTIRIHPDMDYGLMGGSPLWFKYIYDLIRSIGIVHRNPRRW